MWSVSRGLLICVLVVVCVASMVAYCHDALELRKAQECIALSESSEDDLEMSRDHFNEALGRLQWSMVMPGSSSGQSGLAALSRLLRLPYLSLIGERSWHEVADRLRIRAAALRNSERTSSY